MKTSKAYFERFKTEFLRWRDLLGLTQYTISFYKDKLEDEDYAQIKISESKKWADVILNAEIKGSTLTADEGPEAHAKHEVLHLLLNRMVWLGSARYIESSDLNEEWEAIVTRLEKVLK